MHRTDTRVEVTHPGRERRDQTRRKDCLRAELVGSLQSTWTESLVCALLAVSACSEPHLLCVCVG